MFRERVRKFSIRKLSMATASVFIGLGFLGTDNADARVEQVQSQKDISYKYVLESELTDEEKKLILKDLPSSTVGKYETYYMVYRPLAQSKETLLPKTSSKNSSVNDEVALGLGGLLLVGFAFSRKKKKHIVTSLALLTAAGSVNVSALESVKLAGYNKEYRLEVGVELPLAAVEIPNHEFIGYIVEDKDEAVSVETAEEKKQVLEEKTHSSLGVTNLEGETPSTVEPKPEGNISVSTLPGQTPPTLDEKPSGNISVTNLEGEVPPIVEPKPEGNISVSTLPGQTPPTLEEKPTGNISVTNLEGETPPTLDAKPELPEKDVKAEGNTKPEINIPSTNPISNGNTDSGTTSTSDEAKPIKPEIKKGESLKEPVKPEVAVSYVADSNLENGTKGQIVANQEGTSLTVAIGTKPQVTKENIVPKTIEYVADKNSNLTAGEEVSRIEGQDGYTETTKTYSVDSSTGKISENSTSTQVNAVNEVVTISTKPIERTELIPKETRYEANEALEANVQNIKSEGQDGSKVYEIGYDLDSNTGKVSEKAPVLKSESSAKEKVVEVGTKETLNTSYRLTENKGYEKIETKITYTLDTTQGTTTPTSTEKVVESVNPSSRKENIVEPVVKYQGDENSDQVAGTELSRTQGTAGYTEITTSYRLENNQPLAEETRKTVAKVDTIVVKSTKPETIRRDEVAKGTTYEENPNSSDIAGTKTLKTEGRLGYTEENRRYSLDAATGDLVPNVTTNTVTMLPDVYLVSTKPITETDPNLGEREVTYSLNRDTGEVTRVEGPWKKAPAVVVKKEPEIDLVKVGSNSKEKSANVTFTITDSDNTITNRKLKVYKKATKEEVKSYDLAEGQSSPYKITDLEHNIVYEAKLEVTYDLGDGVKTKEDVSEEFELIAKKIEFKNLRSAGLYKVESNGEATEITSLTSEPTDKDNYLIKLVDKQNKEILLAVDKVVANGDKFKVSAKLENLVHYENNVEAEDFVLDINKVEVKEGHYTKFSELIDAIKKKPQGTFYISSDMNVEKATAEGLAYINNFSGTLASEVGKRFSIKGLDKPLFGSLSGTVSNLNIEGANIQSIPAGQNIGILSQTANNASINNIYVAGTISGTEVPSAIGGLAGAANGGRAENVVLDVTMNLPAKAASQSYNAGGMYGAVGNIPTTASKADIKVNITAPNGVGTNIGGLVGELNPGSNISNVRLSGNITATSQSQTVAGVVGRNVMSVITNIMTSLKVTNGSATMGFSYSPMPVPVKVVPSDEQNTPPAAWNIPSRPTLSTGNTNTSQGLSTGLSTYPVDYRSINNYKASHDKAYENFEKLLPFYDRNTIVKTANKVADNHKLNTNSIRSIVPMKGNEFVTNLFDTSGVDKLLIHFDNNTVEEYDLKETSDSPNDRITEYSFGSGLLYTPHQLSGLNTKAIQDAATAFKAVNYKSVPIATALKLTAEDVTKLETDSKFNKLDQLYLEETFNKVKTNIETMLSSMVSSQFAADTNSDAVNRFLNKELTDHKEKVLLGLSYLTRWYNIDFGIKNVKDLATYRPDFFGDAQIDLLAYLAGIGGAGYEKLNHHNTSANTLYKEQIAPYTGQADLYAYLEKNRELFEPTKTTQNWFKESVKVHIVEAEKTVATAEHDIYNRLKKSPDSYSKWLLPLLTAEKDSLFVVVHTPSISVGSFDRYIAPADVANEATRTAKIEAIKANELPKYTKSLAEYYKFWYDSAAATVRNKFADYSVNIYDGLNMNNLETGSWAGRYVDFDYVKNFVGPIGAWFPENTNEEAYTDLKTMINMQKSKLLNDTGFATLGHELVHYFDKEIMLNGFGHRDGQNVESYAMGLLESPSGFDGQGYGLNIMFENGNVLSTTNRNKSRFKTAQDFKDYMKRFYDITYTLDGLEAKAILSLEKSKQAEFFEQISTTSTTAVERDGVTRTRVRDVIVPIANYAGMNIDSIKGLIDNNLVMKGIRTVSNEAVFTTDNNITNYTFVPLYKPIYAAMSSDTSGVGSLQFRKTAFDVLADKGWEDGFIKYASNQLKQGTTTLSDKAVLENIFGAGFNYKEYRDKQFADRLAQVTNLKPITLTSGQVDGLGLQKRIEGIIKSNIPTDDKLYQMQLLKREVIRFYLKETDDLKVSIYKN